MENTINIATYPTRAAAQDAILLLEPKVYNLSHGEYARPDYTARKMRGQDAYYIYARYYYNVGTLYAKCDGAITIESIYQ